MEYVGEISAVLILLLTLFAVARKLHGFMSHVEEFLEDWFGQPARPGRTRIPGVMERLGNLEAELTPNGGGSMKDDVSKVAVDVESIKRQMDSEQQ